MKKYMFFIVEGTPFVYIKSSKTMLQVNESMYRLKELNMLIGIPFLAIIPAILLEKWYYSYGSPEISISIFIAGTIVNILATITVVKRAWLKWETFIERGRAISLSPDFLKNFIKFQKRVIVVNFSTLFFFVIVSVLILAEFFFHDPSLKYLIGPLTIENYLFSTCYMTGLFTLPKTMFSFKEMLRQKLSDED